MDIALYVFLFIVVFLAEKEFGSLRARVRELERRVFPDND